MTNDLTTQTVALPAIRAGKFREFVARNDLASFFVLAFLFSWYPWIIALVRGTTSGPNPLGPLIAALIVTGIADGRSGIFGLPILICAIAVAIMAVFGQPIALPTAAAARELPERFIFILLFIGLGEEPGWRGFALPRLQKKHSPLVASLILAPIWALWHLPLMGNEFPVAIIPAFLISLLGGTLIQTWLFNRSKGSVFGQMLFHATVNTVGAGLVFPIMKGAAFVSFWYVCAALWLIAGTMAGRALSVAPSGAAAAASAPR